MAVGLFTYLKDYPMRGHNCADYPKTRSSLSPVLRCRISDLREIAPWSECRTASGSDERHVERAHTAYLFVANTNGE